MLLPSSQIQRESQLLSQFKKNQILAYLQVQLHQDASLPSSFNKSQYSVNNSSPECQATIPIYANKKIKIGRGDCDLHLTDDSISLVHCIIWSIQFDEESVPLIYLNDKSLNGTFLNGQKIGKNQTVLLNADDIIEIQFGMKAAFQPATSELDHTDHLVSKTFKNWTISPRIIGSGSFGAVFMAKRKNDKKFYAVKIIDYNTKYKENESSILSTLNHPNIIKIHETHIHGNQILIFEDLICGGDLFSYLVKDGKMHTLPECESILIVYQILLALRYLHENNIVHRDLKLDNILLKTPEPCTKVVLADFGIARSFQPNQRMCSIVGTVEYSAPEIYSSRLKSGFVNKEEKKNIETTTGYDATCDMWSLGVVIHKMLSGISPFFEDGVEENMISAARKGKLDLNSKEWKNVSLNGKRFVKSLLKVDIGERLDCEECFLHPWISTHENSLRKVYETKILTTFN